jgi:hypothetical protein
MQRFALNRQAAGQNHRQTGESIGRTRGAMRQRVRRARKFLLPRAAADAQAERFVKSVQTTALQKLVMSLAPTPKP